MRTVLSIFAAALLLPAGCDTSKGPSGAASPGALVMHHARVGHTQTRLADGRTLLAGGLQNVIGILPPANNDVELFEPRTGTFRLIARMESVRMMHTATLLADGRVVFIGGTGGTHVDVFDPHTNRLEDGGDVLGIRAIHTATLLGDGRILLVGGITMAVTYSGGGLHDEMRYLQSVEVYDPRTKSSRMLGCQLLVPRRGHTTTLLDDGRVLVIGGSRTPRTELIDPAAQTVTWGPPLVQAREDHRTTRLPDGRCLVTGGSNPRGKSLDVAEIFDPKTGKFRALAGRMNRQREDHTADLLPDGRVLITGGEDNAAAPGGRDIVIDDVELFDPKTETFLRLPPLAQPRDDHRSSLIADHVVLVTGGEDDNDLGIRSAEFVVVPEREKQNPGGR